MIWLYFGCVMKYGQPFEVDSKSVPVQSVDFSALEAKINGRLLADIPVLEQQRCRQLEQLMIRAKSWDYKAQKDLHDYVVLFLSDIPMEESDIEEELIDVASIDSPSIVAEEVSVEEIEEHP